MQYALESTEHFDTWFAGLKDRAAKRRILARFDMVSNGHFGDHKRLGLNFFEIRMFYGAGYRVYFTIRDNRIVMLLAGGDKASQEKDIKKAREMLRTLEEEQ